MACARRSDRKLNFRKQRLSFIETQLVKARIIIDLTSTPHRPTLANRAKFRNTFSSVYVSLGNKFLDGPITPIQLGQLYPSTVSPGDRALYNEGHRCPGEGLNIDLLIRHTPFPSDAVDVAFFQY